MVSWKSGVGSLESKKIKRKYINYNYNNIERYLGGRMSSAEMHAFEEAMMDDPMLADAVEGYRSAAGATNATEDLSLLREKLKAENTNQAKVVKGSFRQWMSIAAGLVVLLSAAVVLYRIFGADDQPVKEETIAKNTTIADSAQQLVTKVDSTTVAVNETKAAPPKSVTIIAPGLKEPDQLRQKKQEPAVVKTELTGDDYRYKDEVSSSGVTQPVPAPTQPAGNKPSIAAAKEIEDYARSDKKQVNEVKLNKFTGQVVDEHNQPLAFSNVREKTSGVGTYTDAKGYFTIVSSDTVVSVETRSVGYTNHSVQLRTNQQQRIVMKDEAVVANAPTREQFYKRSQKANTDSADIYDTEPADGWNNYNAYVLNNNREADANEKRKVKEIREVELSFDVNPDGSLANIKVEKSNCRSCNAEAIRLLKEGPKWKSKTGKTERTKYTIQF